MFRLLCDMMMLVNIPKKVAGPELRAKRDPEPPSSEMAPEWISPEWTVIMPCTGTRHAG
jgi:hypothetical protein